MYSVFKVNFLFKFSIFSGILFGDYVPHNFSKYLVISVKNDKPGQIMSQNRWHKYQWFCIVPRSIWKGVKVPKLIET